MNSDRNSSYICTFFADKDGSMENRRDSEGRKDAYDMFIFSIVSMMMPAGAFVVILSVMPGFPLFGIACLVYLFGLSVGISMSSIAWKSDEGAAFVPERFLPRLVPAIAVNATALTFFAGSILAVIAFGRDISLVAAGGAAFCLLAGLAAVLSWGRRQAGLGRLPLKVHFATADRDRRPIA